MSASPSNVVVTLKLAEKYLYQIGCPILIGFGVFGTVVNLLVFTQKLLRKNPCSIYFVAHNVANFLYICASLMSLTIGLGYKADITTNYLPICRVRLYAVALFNVLSSFYLVLASIDRVMITSRNAVTRRRSTARCAYTCIVIGTVFWAAFHTHALVLSTITMLAPNVYLCYFQAGAHLVFMGYYSTTKEVGTLIFLAVCGYWSIRSIRKAHRVLPSNDRSATRSIQEHSSHSNSAKDRQLVVMLLMDIGMYLLCSVAFAVFLMYQQITQNQVKSADQTTIETVIRNMCLFMSGIPFCLTCYTNLLVSKTFRSEVKKVFACQKLFGTH